MSKLKQFREALHQIPETAYNEIKTKAYLKKTLTEMGYQPQDILKTGLYVYIDNSNPTSIMFRTDIDALPTYEENTVEYKSTHEGYMHACGHDGHMAILLGLADYLKDKQTQLKENVLLIFQPAEESQGGAKPICDKGLLKNKHVTKSFGIHLYPEISEGVIGSKPNEFMAMVSEIDIEVIGKTSHGAMPHLGVDANLIISKLLIDLQTIQSRNVSPLEYAILTFGRIEGGSVRNSISDYAKMSGTLRAYNQETFNLMKQKIYDLKTGYESMYHCRINISIPDGYLPVINDETLYKSFREALNNHPYHEFKKPLMIAEDFSFYQQDTPGIFYYIGTRNEELGYTHSLHSPHFNFNSNVLDIGLDSYITLLKYFNIL